MANRSYLYGCDEIPDGKRAVRPRGLHEWNREVPFIHKLMLTKQPAIVTYAAGNVDRLGIAAERDDDHVVAFLDKLATGDLADREDFDRELAAMKEFLAAHPSPFVFLDATEIFAMSDAPLQRQARSLLTSIQGIDKKSHRVLTGGDVPWLGGLRAKWRDEVRLGTWTEILWLRLDGKPSAAQPVRPYAASERFAVDEQIEHPTFGAGVVTLSEPGKVTVLFGTGRRVLQQPKP